MSRSYRKTPIYTGSSHDSDAWYKKSLHRRLRAQIKQALVNYEGDSLILPTEKGLFDSWWSAKDWRGYRSPWVALYSDSVGYAWVTDQDNARYLKEERERHKRAMRK